MSAGVISGPNQESGSKTVQLLVLQPTPFCNIDCDYCYLANRLSTKKMLPKQAAEIVDRLVSAGVVGDRDRPTQLEAVGEITVQAPDGHLETGFLVVDRDHDVDVDNARGGCAIEREERGAGHGPMIRRASECKLGGS